MIEQIVFEGKLFAIIIRNDYSERGINFLTESDDSMQIAFMRHSEGHEIQPHLHNAVERKVFFTKEVLFIRKGILKVDFYDFERMYIKSTLLKSGDVIFLSDGGHGFQVIEEVEMIEVKQGPFVGSLDKVRFNS